MKFEYKGNIYPVEIIKKIQNKNTYIRVKKDLTLYITTNVISSDKSIEKLIKENRKAIEKMYEKQLTKKENNTGFYYLGKRYDIVYTNGKEITFGEIKVFVGKDINIDNWYKKEAKKIFKEHLDNCYNNFTNKIPYPSLRIRKMTSRWGVCNYKDIVVTLNLELIKRDLDCLDYVIYHELSHLIHHDHSDKFWLLVEENYPNYKIVRRKMKNY